LNKRKQKLKINQIKNLSRSDIWDKEWFLEMLINGFRNDGVKEYWLDIIKNFILENKLKSFKKFIDEFKIYLEKNKFENKDEILIFLENLFEKTLYNETCYYRADPAKTRVIQWPNNQNTKIKNPQHYFNIYEDIFYRERFPIITKKTGIGSAGSCFARAIAHQLQRSGFNYVIEEDDLPKDFPIENLSSSPYRVEPARYGVLFNTPSIRQMIERGFGYWNPEFIIAENNGKLIDPFRSVANLYDDYEGFLTDYEKHNKALKKALLKCDVFIITLGLTEAWYFAHSGKYTSVSPHKINPVLLRQKNLNLDENLKELEKIFEIYKKHQPNIKFIISVSPIPLNKTFSKTKHVVEATGLSKAILRLAANQFSINHPKDVFYLPSFETVMYGCQDPWEINKRHVNPKAVARVMELFANMFVKNPEEFKFSHIDPMKEIKSSPIIKIKNLLRPIKRKIMG
tara:strand:+ start:2003 stop:3370 length:1368 start_codon:yes stop_codon:yes gene_type:complete